ncbi:epoxide hydrolase protein [Rutstroemia sp. NJR-2017a BBW]|nr:epoxide hydrolase protein [Rutstroemia sp. NJR-2017a BBW]
MSQEDVPIEFVLEGIESIMASIKQPKVILFDIGGVCVDLADSCFPGVVKTSRASTPPIMHAIQYQHAQFKQLLESPQMNASKTHTTCFLHLSYSPLTLPPRHRLERGELELNASWFRGFTSDLHNPSFWTDFYNSVRAKHSLPAEVPPVPQIDGEKLFWSMMDNSRALDPW